MKKNITFKEYIILFFLIFALGKKQLSLFTLKKLIA